MRYELLLAAAVFAIGISAAAGQDIDLAGQGSDVQESFDPSVEAFNFTRREEMIPMRDGMKLFTVIVTPKNIKSPMPIVLTRTPYDDDKRTQTSFSTDAAMILDASDEIYPPNGYIRVYQDVRGLYGSEGEYVMIRPPRDNIAYAKPDEYRKATHCIYHVAGAASFVELPVVGEAPGD
jgi:predicted acyl esterase